MKPVLWLKVAVMAILVFMLWEIVVTSLSSNLFEELPTLVRIPWMEATLYDFYANLLFLFLWVNYKERRLHNKVLWFILMVALGSVATCIYVLKELFRLDAGEDLKTVLLRQNN